MLAVDNHVDITVELPCILQGFCLLGVLVLLQEQIRSPQVEAVLLRGRQAGKPVGQSVSQSVSQWGCQDHKLQAVHLRGVQGAARRGGRQVGSEPHGVVARQDVSE